MAVFCATRSEEHYVMSISFMCCCGKSVMSIEVFIAPTLVFNKFAVLQIINSKNKSLC